VPSSLIRWAEVCRSALGTAVRGISGDSRAVQQSRAKIALRFVAIQQGLASVVAVGGVLAWGRGRAKITDWEKVL